MSVSGLLLLFVAMLAASRPSIGLVAAIGILLPFEANSLLTSTNLITADVYLLMIVAYCVTRFLATGRIRVGRLNLLIIAICIVGVLVTLFAPRLFAGEVLVIPLDAVVSNVGVLNRIMTTPLRPTGTNISQLIYHLLYFMGLACLCGLAVRAGLERLSMALKLAAGINIALVVLAQVLGPQILDAFFTASYTDLREARAFGTYRAVGGFREAARQGQFAAMCFGYFMTAYVLSRGTLNGWLAFGSLAVAALAFSSTALLGVIFATFAILWLVFVLGLRGEVNRGMFSRVGFVVASASVAAVVVLLAGGGAAEDFVADLVTGLTVGKLASASGIERLALFAISVDVVVQTYGIGCGLGCTRGNGLWLVIAANGGLITVALLLLIVANVVAPRLARGQRLDRETRMASYPALIAFLTLLASLSASLTVPNVGIVFVVMAALCWCKRVGLPDRDTQRAQAAASAPAPAQPAPARGTRQLV